jgi:hypothetical protein
VSTAAERLAEAKARDEEGIEQDAPEEIEQEESTPFEAPEQPDTESETQPEPEQPEQPEPAGRFNAEQTAELEKASIAYLKRVGKALGGELPPECRECGGLGFDLTYGAGQPEYRTASDKDVCDECDGLGGVLSGSKVPGQDVVRCERCKGAGYLVTREVTITDPDQVAPVVVALADGTAHPEQVRALRPGEPGWEPWMGGGDAQVGP